MQNVEEGYIAVIKEVLEKWKNSDRSQYALRCPICMHPGRTLAVRIHGDNIDGICSECGSVGRIPK